MLIAFYRLERMSTYEDFAKAKDNLERLQAALTEELATLHERYGLKSPEDLCDAILEASSSGGKRKRGKVQVRGNTKPAKVAKQKAKQGKAHRAKITDEVRAQVKRLVNEGKSGQEISKTLKISLPSVQNIKKALGLVKSRGGKSPQPAATEPTAPAPLL